MINVWATSGEATTVGQADPGSVRYPSDQFWQETSLSRANVSSFVMRKPCMRFHKALLVVSIYQLVSPADSDTLVIVGRVPGIPLPIISQAGISLCIFFFPFWILLFPFDYFFTWKWNLGVENSRSGIKALTIRGALEADFDGLSYSTAWDTVW